MTDVKLDDVQDRLLRTAEAADLLGLKPQTLYQAASEGRPFLPIVRIGRSVRYRQSDLQRLIAAHAA